MRAVHLTVTLHTAATGKPHFFADEETLLWGLKTVLWGFDGGERPTLADKEEL
jgi:hypothetical protein